MARRGTIQSMTPYAAGFGSSTAEAGGFLGFVCALRQLEQEERR